jgi:hypothetical protein
MMDKLSYLLLFLLRILSISFQYRKIQELECDCWDLSFSVAQGSPWNKLAASAFNTHVYKPQLRRKCVKLQTPHTAAFKNNCCYERWNIFLWVTSLFMVCASLSLSPQVYLSYSRILNSKFCIWTFAYLIISTCIVLNCFKTCYKIVSTWLISC